MDTQHEDSDDNQIKESPPPPEPVLSEWA